MNERDQLLLIKVADVLDLPPDADSVGKIMKIIRSDRRYQHEQMLVDLHKEYI